MRTHPYEKLRPVAYDIIKAWANAPLPEKGQKKTLPPSWSEALDQADAQLNAPELAKLKEEEAALEPHAS